MFGYRNRLPFCFIKVVLLLFLVLNNACSQGVPKRSIQNSVEKNSQIYKIKSLKNHKIGCLEILPLPTGYPPSLVKNEAVFTGEIYTSQPDDSLSSRSIFIPTDYRDIIESTILTSLKLDGIWIVRYPNITAAYNDGASVVLIIAPLNFHVENEEEATVKLNFTLIKCTSLALLWEGVVTKKIDKELPSTLEDSLIVAVGNHKYNFQPQRALLAEGVYHCAQSFFKKAGKEMEKWASQ